MRNRTVEGKSFVALGVDFSSIPQMTSEVVSNLLKNATEGLRNERANELDPRNPRNPEAPHLASPSQRRVIVDFARTLRK